MNQNKKEGFFALGFILLQIPLIISGFYLGLNQFFLVLLTFLPFIFLMVKEGKGLGLFDLKWERLKSSIILGLILSLFTIILFRKINFVFDPSIAVLLLPLLMVGFSEELIYRGFLQKRLSKWLGGTRGLLLSSFIFSGIHLPQRILVTGFSLMEIIFSLLAVFLLGLVFGLLYEKTKNVAGGAIFHSVFDWLQKI